MKQLQCINYSRREAIRVLTIGASSIFIPNTLWANCYSKSSRPTLHNYSDYSWLRGFNIIPSWGARIEDAWLLYNPKKMRQELQLAKSVHANTIRLWIDFPAWMINPELISNRFLDAITAIDEAGMKTMPCLFNRWHDLHYDYGGLYIENIQQNWSSLLEYVSKIVEPLANDQRILMWDICNEPQIYGNNKSRYEQEQLEIRFLEEVAKTVRDSGARQPLTIGSGYCIEQSKLIAHIPDVICSHPYSHSKVELENQIEQLKVLSKKIGKPVIVNESIPGSLSDLKRSEITKLYIEKLSSAGFGWMGWALCEGKAVATRKDRCDPNGIDGEGFHPFFTDNGKLRKGLEFLKLSPKMIAPWKL